MSDFFQWSTALPTAQAMLSGEYRRVVRELVSHWEGRAVLRVLSTSRRQLSRLSKRAARAAGAWQSETGDSLREALGSKPSARQIAAVEAIIDRLRARLNGFVAVPPTSPAPALNRHTYMEWTKGVSRPVRTALARSLRRLPQPLVALHREQVSNPWLAAWILDRWLDESANPEELLPWLAGWNARHRLPTAAEAAADWMQWRKGNVRLAPPEVERFLAFQLGLVIDGLRDASFEGAAGFVQLAQPSEPVSIPATAAALAAGTNESRVYTLKEAAKSFGPKVWTMREAVRRGELKCSRPTAASNAPIYLRDCDIRDWLAAQTGKRQRATPQKESPGAV
jgi:hypothetical protein